jgi:hypothetical protein
MIVMTSSRLSRTHGHARPTAGSARGKSHRIPRSALVAALPLVAAADKQIGGYRASVLARPSQRVTVIAVTGQSVVPRLRRSR